jgi:hypothetical protein
MNVSFALGGLVHQYSGGLLDIQAEHISCERLKGGVLDSEVDVLLVLLKLLVEHGKK